MEKGVLAIIQNWVPGVEHSQDRSDPRALQGWLMRTGDPSRLLLGDNSTEPLKITGVQNSGCWRNGTSQVYDSQTSTFIVGLGSCGSELREQLLYGISCLNPSHPSQSCSSSEGQLSSPFPLSPVPTLLFGAYFCLLSMIINCVPV